MAITLEQLRQKYTRSADEMDLFCKAAGYLLAGLNTYRESCLVSGLPFCGKLEQSYQTLSTSLKSLATEALDFDYKGAALTEALKAMDQLGPFLNVKVGPGDRTIRDVIAAQDLELQKNKQRQQSLISEKEEPRQSFHSEEDEALQSFQSQKNEAGQSLASEADDLTAADSLRLVSEFLELPVGREEAPLFDYWKDNMPQPQAAGRNLGPMLQEPASVALTRMRRALRDSGSNEDRVRLLADLFAGRIAAGATRNDRSHLERTQITSRQINTYAEQLMKNPLFRQFAAENMDQLLRLAQKRGHGGLLEERFQSFLLKLPGGKLRNDPILKRYMPNCKERINVLKKEIKARKGLSNASDPMAEIVVLRSLVHADRHNVESLNVPIPTDPSNTLGNCSEILAYESDFLNCLSAGVAAADHGHGGRMVEALRAEEKKNAKENGDIDPAHFTRLLLNKTTYQGRMRDLQVRAFCLREQIRHGRPVDEQVKLQYRELCLENFGLSDQVNSEHLPSGTDVDEVRVREKMEILGENPQFSPANALNLKEEEVTRGLEAIIDTKGLGYHVPKYFPNRIGSDGKLRADSLDAIGKNEELKLP